MENSNLKHKTFSSEAKTKLFDFSFYLIYIYLAIYLSTSKTKHQNTPKLCSHSFFKFKILRGVFFE